MGAFVPRWMSFVLVVLLLAPAVRAQEVHYSSDERLDAIDVQLISTAKQSVDFTSRPNCD